MFKRLTGILCLIIICATASAAVSVRTENGSALLSADGATIAEWGRYADIVPLGGDLFAAGDAGSYALMNAQGEGISAAGYGYLECADYAVIAEKDGKLGLLDKSGREISGFEYAAITEGENGVYWALSGDSASALGMELCILGSGVENKTGLRLLGIGNRPYNGLLSARLSDGHSGYIDAEGNMAIAAQFQHASDFVNGCAAVALDDKFGAIDTSGALIIPAEYDFLQVSEYGYIIAAQMAGRVAVFDMHGALIDEYFGENISIGLVGRHYTVCDEISLRVYSESHEMLFETAPTASVSVGIGDQLIVSRGTFGENSTRIRGTERDYQNIVPLGVIDGEAVYASISVNAVKYEDNMLGEIQYALDMTGVRCGVIDSKGEKLLEDEYLSVEMLGEDRLLVQTEYEWQMIDISGKVYWSGDVKTQPSAE